MAAPAGLPVGVQHAAAPHEASLGLRRCLQHSCLHNSTPKFLVRLRRVCVQHAGAADVEGS